MVILTVCSYHVTYTFQNEFTLYSCLNFKKRLAWNRRDIWSLSGSNGIQTHNQLIHKRTLNHLSKLDKWLGCVVSTYLHCAFDYMLIWLCVPHFVVAWISRNSFLETGNYRVWIQSEKCMWHDKNIQPNAPYRRVLTTQLNHLASLAKWLSFRLRT